jgi:hypothetical protein
MCRTGCSDRQRTLWVLLSRSTPLCKDQSPCVGGAAKLACQFERLVACRPWGHQACKFQGVRCEVVPFKPVRQALCFHAHRSAELPLPRLVKVIRQQDSDKNDVIPALAGRRLIGKARKNRFLRMADAAADEKSGARRIAGLECLYDVVASVRGALGKLRAHA